MALDVRKWLMEDMGFSEKEIDDNHLVDAFTSRAERVEKGYLRQADYSTKMNALQADLQTQTANLTAAQQRLDAEVAEWATVQASGRQITEKMRTDLDTAQAERLRLEQLLRKTATDAGLNPDDLLRGITPAPAPTPTPAPPPAIDTSKFVDRADYQRLARMALLVPAQLDRIQREHHDLTGEYLNPEELTAEVEARASTRGNTRSIELRDIWEEKFEIPAKRAAKAKATYDAAILDAEKRGAERALTESALPGGGVHPVGKHAPIFQRSVNGAARTSVLQRPQPGTRTADAVTALRTGKYRQPSVGGPPAAAKPG